MWGEEAEVLSHLQLVADKGPAGCIDERLCRGAVREHQLGLDRLVEILVVDAERHELERREEPLPADVIARDRRLDEIRIADLAVETAWGRIERRRELAEFGAGHRLAVREANVHILARRVDQVDTRQRIEVVLARLLEEPLVVERLQLDVGVLDAGAADEPQTIGDERETEHAVPRRNLLACAKLI